MSDPNLTLDLPAASATRTRPQARRAGRRLAVLAVAAVAASAAMLAAGPAAQAATNVGGSLSCVTGNPVEGVWVAANSSTAGWARLNVASGSSSTVSWTFSLNRGGSYYIHVGCGGSPSNWAVNAYSGTTSGNLNGQICYDTRYETGGLYGRCQ